MMSLLLICAYLHFPRMALMYCYDSTCHKSTIGYIEPVTFSFKTI